MDFLPALRELVRTYQAFDTFSAQHIRTLGLTTSQFDVIATLGNTQGMTCREVGEKTLMVKGTLTGVLDRLERKKLITRSENPKDKRSVLIHLTPSGEKLFARVFPAHLEYLKPAFESLGKGKLAELQQILGDLRQTLEKRGDAAVKTAASRRSLT
jgi:MarR family 2-MHQ and catechol resistance regulon transcriptional repressor